MSLFNSPLADSLIRPLRQQPLLTVVIPTFSRPAELAFAVASIADQIDAALEGKIEIIVSDNASGPETQVVLRQLAETYPALSYYIHAENYGGPYQICSAPHRARGRWTWVFGDDDALEEGGLAAIVDVLERDSPGFLTINRQVWNKTFDQCIMKTRHDVPDLRFDTFIELLTLFGFDQLSFLTSQVYATDIARSINAKTYLESPCRYAQLAYYLEAFHNQTSYYLSQPVVRHRWDQDAADVHAANFHHLATLLPELVQLAADRAGLAPGLFEQISGRRSLVGPEGRKTTFVDNILQNLWRSVAVGTTIPEAEWTTLQKLSSSWRPGRSEDLDSVHDAYHRISATTQSFQALVANHQVCTSANRQDWSQSEIDLLLQSEATILSLQSKINDARKMAHQVSMGFE